MRSELETYNFVVIYHNIIINCFKIQICYSTYNFMFTSISITAYNMKLRIFYGANHRNLIIIIY